MRKSRRNSDDYRRDASRSHIHQGEAVTQAWAGVSGCESPKCSRCACAVVLRGVCNAIVRLSGFVRMSGQQSAIGQPDKAPKGPPVGALASGLVSFTTRHTPDVVEIDLIHSRLSRMATSIRTSARLHCEALGNDRNKYHCVMWTLTYADAQAWEPKHIQKFLTVARNWAGRKKVPLRYAWVAEIQPKRLAETGDAVVHYHILVWAPTWLRLPFPDQKGWWRHGKSNTKKVYAPVKYAIKYTSKGTSDVEKFPVGARLYGVGGLDADQRNERIWWAMPSYVRERATIQDQPRRAKGGGFILRATGEFLPSAWLFVSVGNGYVKIRPRPTEGDSTLDSNRTIH